MNKNETNQEAIPVRGLGGALQAVDNGNDDLHLTDEERRLILNFRAVEACAQEMLVDLSGQYKRTLPAAPVCLRVVGG
jgi:hypothetical protein